MGFDTEYFRCSNCIFDLGLKPNELTILLYLIRLGNNTGVAFPSMDNIVKVCHVSKATVSTVLRQLSKDGYITTISKYGKNTYKINYVMIEKHSKVESKNSKKVETIEEKLVRVTGVSIEKVKEVLEKVRSLNRVKNIFGYAKAIILNNKNKEIVPAKSNTSTSSKQRYNKFNDFPQRDYNFNKMEKDLLQKDTGIDTSEVDSFLNSFALC